MMSYMCDQCDHPATDFYRGVFINRHRQLRWSTFTHLVALCMSCNLEKKNNLIHSMAYVHISREEYVVYEVMYA